MTQFLNLRNIFVAMILLLSVCLHSSNTIAKTTTTTTVAITADTPNNCTNCAKKQQPHSFKHKMKTKVPLREVNSEYAYNKFQKRKNPYKDISLYVGIASGFKSSMDTSGVWETLPNGDRVWRMQLHSDSDWLKGIGVQTTELILPEGCTLFFYSPDKKQLVGPVLPADPLGTRQRIVNTIAGKDICIEYYEPKAQKGKGLFNIDFLLYRLNDFPYGTTHRLKKTVPIASPYSKWRNDHISETIEKMPLKQLGSVAEQPTNYTLDNSGVWETLPNGDRVWRLGIRCELGYAISLWTKIVIPKGGYFTYYSPDGYYVSSLYTAPSNSYNNDLFTADMPGKELIVEYYEPKNAKGKGSVQVLRVELNITKWHTAALERGDREEQDLGEPTCSPNVVCDCDEFIDTVTTTPTFCSTSLLDLPETLKKSVVRIRRYFPCAASTPDSLCLQEPGGTGVEVYEPGGLPPFCTGTLLNNADCKPYVLTASHCLRRGLNPELLIPYNSEQSQEVYFRFDFNFDSESCNIALSPTEQAQDRIQTGAKLHAISVRLNTTGIDASENATGIGDFMLLELKQSIPPEYNAMFAGWNAEQTLPDKGVSVSHPSGYDKRFALQDDSISQITITPEVYNGVRPFRNNNPNYIANISTTDSNNNNHGSYFGLTFDRGSVLGGSSGSGYFNPTGQLIGTLSGGPGECRTSAMPQFSHPNGNNNMLTHYGRFWYYYDHVPTEGTNWNTQTAKQIEASTSEGGATITAYEKRHTLKTWLGSTTNSMGAVEVQNCEIYLKDNTWDNSHNEPNQTALIDNSWYDIWESPDLWNTTVAFNTDIDPENYEALLGSDNEEPDFIDNTSDELLDNYIRYNVRTPYTNECTTQPASLHLYWTIASTGEMWPDHWINHYVDNNCLVGQEITIHSNGDPYPVAIDPLAENSTWEGYVHWSPPNFTDPTVDDYYPFTSVIDNCPSINADADNNDKVEICLLARLQSLDNPIFGIETANTAQNVLNSNNIVTRNTFLADPGIVGMAPDGGPSGNIISYGHPSIILIANNNDYVKNLDITLDKISEGSTEALEQLMYIDLIPGDELWQKWESTGFKGEGIQIIAEKVIRVTNLETAKLLDIPFDAKEFEPLKIKVTIISYTGKRPSVADLPDEYKFRVSHRASRPTEQGSINPPTDCLFTVKDIAKYGSTALPTEISLKVYPNPFKDQLNIVFTLPTDSPVSLNLYDIQGRLIKNINSNTALPAGLNTYQIDTNDLPKGMYICHLIANKTAVAKKVVK